MNKVMPALKVHELQKLAQQIKLYGLGHQLQDIALSEQYLFLQHYGKGDFTIGVELKPLEPQLAYFFGDIPKRKILVKPLVLFLKAHARNLRLVNVVVELELGRVLRLYYSGGDRECVVELRLIPHGMNILISAGGKSISLFPAKDLPPSSVGADQGDAEFDVEAYLDQWMQRLLNPAIKKSGGSPQDDQARKKKKEIEKKTVLIGKLEDDLKAMSRPWLPLGEYLKIHQTLEVPEDWLPLLDINLPVNANMQRCFEKHKLQEKRFEQISERIQHLRQEICELESASLSGDVSADGRTVRSLASELLGKAKAKGRKLKLAENIEAVFGKSAKDNMALLRRAQAWDLWLHLRDLPGAHLIVRRPRQKNVDHHLLLEAARWLLSETVGKKKVIEGDRYDVIVTECRYVKPIKGDKLGRVNYQNESTLTLRV
jgi:hypothetical protein